MSALAAEFARTHGRTPAVVLREWLTPIPRLFGLEPEVDEALVSRAERNEAFQRSHDNLLLSSSEFYAHPSFARSQVRVDALTSNPSASQADMYRAVLQLPPTARLSLPDLTRLTTQPPVLNSVLIIPEATSWPNHHPRFWESLSIELVRAGRDVVHNDKRWSLDELLRRAATSEWVIGPQCGVMSILVAGRFPCRKTLATPSIDGNDFHPWARDTYPYGYVTKFDGHDYDLEEWKITDTNHRSLIDLILAGPNARRARPVDPSPATTLAITVTPGDLLDRLAVLEIKARRFDENRRALILRELSRLREQARPLLTPAQHDAPAPEIRRLFRELLLVHADMYDVMERLVPAALNGQAASDGAASIVGDHVKAISLNRTRVALRESLDHACHAPYGEVKSYYDG